MHTGRRSTSHIVKRRSWCRGCTNVTDRGCACSLHPHSLSHSRCTRRVPRCLRFNVFVSGRASTHVLFHGPSGMQETVLVTRSRVVSLLSVASQCVCFCWRRRTEKRTPTMLASSLRPRPSVVPHNVGWLWRGSSIRSCCCSKIRCPHYFPMFPHCWETAGIRSRPKVKVGLAPSSFSFSLSISLSLSLALSLLLSIPISSCTLGLCLRPSSLRDHILVLQAPWLVPQSVGAMRLSVVKPT